MMKAYLIDAWEAGMEEVGRVFESINLAILIATDAGDVGLDSSDCMGVFQEGPFSSKTALAQKMGRIRSKLNSDASLTIFMSVALWAKLLLRIRSSDGAKGEIQRQERDLAAVLRLLLSESPLCLKPLRMNSATRKLRPRPLGDAAAHVPAATQAWGWLLLLSTEPPPSATCAFISTALRHPRSRTSCPV